MRAKCLYGLPRQVVVCGVTSKHDQYVEEVGRIYKKSGIKVSTDLRNEKIGFKIRDHTLQKVPYLLVVGDREVEDRSVSVRRRGVSDVQTMSLDEFQKTVAGMIKVGGKLRWGVHGITADNKKIVLTAI